MDIRYRMYDKETGEIHQVRGLDLQNDVVEYYVDNGSTIDWYERDFVDVELLRWTGVQDVHGDDLYEGDVVIVTRTRGGVLQENKGVITYNREYLQWIIADGGETLFPLDHINRGWFKFERKGSMYDNVLKTYEYETTIKIKERVAGKNQIEADVLHGSNRAGWWDLLKTTGVADRDLKIKAKRIGETK